MVRQYHILNGDALRAQFQEEIEGKIIVIRECLVDGPVAGEHLPDFLANRAEFLSTTYGGSTADYMQKVAVELERINRIDNATIHLWFEDDLFCQVNFWFLCHYLHQKGGHNQLFLVRPPEHTRYGFGGLNSEELRHLLDHKLALLDLELLAELWPAYQQDELDQLKNIALRLKSKYPFILDAVQAHLDRIPTETSQGKPIRVLKDIIRDLGTDDFEKIFQEFTKRAPIYGFGDVQVKKLYDKIVDHSQ